MHFWEHPETGVQINHNGDYSGDAHVRFTVPRDRADEWLVTRTGPEEIEVTIKIPCKALAAFGKDATVSEIIGILEQL